MTLTDPPIWAPGTQDEMGLHAGHPPHCRMRGRPEKLPPEGLVLQSGILLAASAGRGRNAVQVPGSATEQGTEVA